MMIHNIRSILCCVGLKNDSDPVLTHAVGLALATGADLQILHVVRSMSDDVLNTLRASIPDRRVLKSLGERRLQDAGTKLDGQIEEFWRQHSDLREAFGERKMPRCVLEGYPASVIAEFSQRNGSDMIVLSANKTSYSSTYPGKITKGVIKRSRVPVVVVPPYNSSLST